jgi:hypothetical protein
MACMLVPPSLEEMKFTPPSSLKEPPKLFNYGLANLAAGTVAEENYGYRNRRGSKRSVRGTCRQCFLSFLHILVLYHSIFFQGSKVLRALNLL